MNDSYNRLKISSENRGGSEGSAFLQVLPMQLPGSPRLWGEVRMLRWKLEGCKTLSYAPILSVFMAIGGQELDRMRGNLHPDAQAEPGWGQTGRQGQV